MNSDSWSIVSSSADECNERQEPWYVDTSSTLIEPWVRYRMVESDEQEMNRSTDVRRTKILVTEKLVFFGKEDGSIDLFGADGNVRVKILNSSIDSPVTAMALVSITKRFDGMLARRDVRIEHLLCGYQNGCLVLFSLFDGTDQEDQCMWIIGDDIHRGSFKVCEIFVNPFDRSTAWVLHSSGLCSLIRIAKNRPKLIPQFIIDGVDPSDTELKFGCLVDYSVCPLLIICISKTLVQDSIYQDILYTWDLESKRVLYRLPLEEYNASEGRLRAPLLAWCGDSRISVANINTGTVSCINLRPRSRRPVIEYSRSMLLDLHEYFDKGMHHLMVDILSIHTCPVILLSGGKADDGKLLVILYYMSRSAQENHSRIDTIHLSTSDGAPCYFGSNKQVYCADSSEQSTVIFINNQYLLWIDPQSIMSRIFEWMNQKHYEKAYDAALAIKDQIISCGESMENILPWNIERTMIKYWLLKQNRYDLVVNHVSKHVDRFVHELSSFMSWIIKVFKNHKQLHSFIDPDLAIDLKISLFQVICATEESMTSYKIIEWIVIQENFYMIDTNLLDHILKTYISARGVVYEDLLKSVRAIDESLSFKDANIHYWLGICYEYLGTPTNQIDMSLISKSIIHLLKGHYSHAYEILDRLMYSGVCSKLLLSTSVSIALLLDNNRGICFLARLYQRYSIILSDMSMSKHLDLLYKETKNIDPDLGSFSFWKFIFELFLPSNPDPIVNSSFSIASLSVEQYDMLINGTIEHAPHRLLEVLVLHGKTLDQVSKHPPFSIQEIFIRVSENWNISQEKTGTLLMPEYIYLLALRSTVEMGGSSTQSEFGWSKTSLIRAFSALSSESLSSVDTLCKYTWSLSTLPLLTSEYWKNIWNALVDTIFQSDKGAFDKYIKDKYSRIVIPTASDILLLDCLHSTYGFTLNNFIPTITRGLSFKRLFHAVLQEESLQSYQQSFLLRRH
jgi:hypothetical protein